MKSASRRKNRRAIAQHPQTATITQASRVMAIASSSPDRGGAPAMTYWPGDL